MNVGELDNLNFQTGKMDEHSFFGLLLRAAYKADRLNTERLRQAFPEHIESVERWKTERGYAEKLMSATPKDLDGKRIE